MISYNSVCTILNFSIARFSKNKYMVQDFILRKWSVWPPLDENDDMDTLAQAELLSSVPKMLKRRLTPLAKIVFSAANLCIGDNTQLPIVFSSTHGELAKSFKMMEMIDTGEDISPTAFSLSVHNAIAGLFSIVYNNKLQSTVVAPGEEGIAAAFIDAIGLLAEGEESVLVVFYDEPLVDFYPTTSFNLSSKDSCATALRITKKGPGLAIRFSCNKEEGNEGEQPVQMPLLKKFLTSNSQSLQIHTPRHTWSWIKR